MEPGKRIKEEKVALENNNVKVRFSQKKTPGVCDLDIFD